MLEKGTMEKRQRSETANMPLYILSLLSRHFLTTSLGLVRNKAACFQKLLHPTIYCNRKCTITVRKLQLPCICTVAVAVALL